MNPWQVAQQIANKLAAAAWPETSGEVVFAAAKVSVSPTESALGMLRFPFALVAPGSATADEENPALLSQDFEIRVAQRVASDPWGELPLIGGPRAGGVKSSDGRGLMEIEEELMRAVGDLAKPGGISLQLVNTSAVGAVEDRELGYVVTREYTMRAWCTTSRTYPPAKRFAATDASGGQAALAWSIPSDRYDYTSLVLRRASGATPPASVTAGTGVAVANKMDTSLTDSPGAGQWSYALFAGYDDLGSGAADRYSSAVTGTVTVT